MKLHLNLTGEYFDQIVFGEKTEEYRLCNDHWTKILKPFPSGGNDMDQIVLKRGYPRKNDKTRILILPWQGYEIKTITHPHFGESPVKVFAIKLAPTFQISGWHEVL